MAIRKIIKRATDALFTNTEFDGTEATRMVKGTTGQRASAEAGDLRFNTTTNLMEYYDGTLWKSIDSPPTISSINPTVETDPSANIVITGSNFQSGATVKFVGDDGTEYPSPTVTIDSATQITATTPTTALSVANEPYDVVVTNTSGLSGTLADALDAGGVPAFTESAGSLGIVYDSARTGLSFDAGATDPDGDTITYSISAGTLPSGLSLNTSTGAITGDATAVGSDTTSTFTVSAATSSDTSTRQFTIEIKAPVVTSYTSSSGTFSVPSGLTAVDALVVAGGGGGGGRAGGGGGAGGLIYRPAFPVTPGGSVSYSIGSGGSGGAPAGGKGTSGQDSTFGGLTAKGGGGGGDAADVPSNQATGLPGGSGGGMGYGGYSAPLSTATQPQQPGDSGTYGFGNRGGAGSGDSAQSQGFGGSAGDYNSAGGGGAGAVGQDGGSPSNAAGDGGAGKQYSISGSQVYYGGGGGGGSHTPHGSASSGGQGGGGNGAINAQNGGQGTANRGGGAGGAGSQGGSGGSGGTGGSGIVIVKY